MKDEHKYEQCEILPLAYVAFEVPMGHPDSNGQWSGEGTIGGRFYVCSLLTILSNKLKVQGEKDDQWAYRLEGTWIHKMIFSSF